MILIGFTSSHREYTRKIVFEIAEKYFTKWSLFYRQFSLSRKFWIRIVCDIEKRRRSTLIDLLIPHSHPQVATGCMNFQRGSKRASETSWIHSDRRGGEKMGERSGVPRYLKLTIAVGSRYRKTREEPPAPPSLFNPARTFYLDFLRTMTIRKLSSLLSRGIPSRFYPFYLAAPHPVGFADWRVSMKREATGKDK